MHGVDRVHMKQLKRFERTRPHEVSYLLSIESGSKKMKRTGETCPSCGYVLDFFYIFSAKVFFLINRCHLVVAQRHPQRHSIAAGRYLA